MRFFFFAIYFLLGESILKFAHTAFTFTFMLRSFCLIFRGQGQLAGGSYLRITLYVLMIHFKKFGTFIRSVPISRLSNRTILYISVDIVLNVIG